MGVEMCLGQSEQQASTASRVLSNRVTAYESLRGSLESFIGTTALQGKTYESAKAYSRQVLIPLLKGCILLDEAIKEACAKLPSEYRSQVEQIDLREEALRDKIYRAGMMASRYEYLATLERQKERPDLTRASQLSRSAGRYIEIEQRLQEKLQQLLAFNSSSVHIFAHIQPLLDAVEQGLKQTNGVWQANDQSFALPAVKDLTWTKTVEDKWGKSPLGIQKLIEKGESDSELTADEFNNVFSKIKNGGRLTERDIRTVKLYKKMNPNWSVPEQIINAVKASQFDWKAISKDFVSKITDVSEWSWGAVGQVFDDLNDVAIKQGKNLGRVFGARLQPRDTLGRFVKDTVKPRALLSGKLKTMSNSTSKFIGHGAKILGFGTSVILEGVDHYKEHKNVGRAISYGTIGGVVALGAGAVAGAIGTALALPAIGTLAVGVAIGSVASVGLKVAYNNIKPVKDFVDGAGDILNKGGEAISNGWNSLGNVFKTSIGSLKGSFVW